MIYLRPNVESSVSVEAMMNELDDWFKYAENSWVVYDENRNAKDMLAMFRPLAESGGALFICQLNVQDRQGWMIKRFWDWIKKDRSKKMQKEE